MAIVGIFTGFGCDSIPMRYFVDFMSRIYLNGHSVETTFIFVDFVTDNGGA